MLDHYLRYESPTSSLLSHIFFCWVVFLVEEQHQVILVVGVSLP
jgi:hypothetical protein